MDNIRRNPSLAEKYGGLKVLEKLRYKKYKCYACSPPCDDPDMNNGLGRYYCTMEKGHEGVYHIAHAGSDAVAVWEESEGVSHELACAQREDRKKKISDKERFIREVLS